MKRCLLLLILLPLAAKAEEPQRFTPVGEPKAELVASGTLPPPLPKALAADGLSVELYSALPKDNWQPKPEQVLLTSNGALFKACQEGPFKACIFLNAQYRPDAIAKPTLDLVNAPRLPLEGDMALRQKLLPAQPDSRFYALALRENTPGESQELATIISGWLETLKKKGPGLSPSAP
ncbi:MAG: hypothetical protein VX447_02025 [Pseudomonadota bacterium]|uniref:hypothetical protein n=1 Tax=Gallaecimonas pentaromativorans TaxID=584787 RepID=UPI00067EA55D|nr:hypothetical protein [Gallaecimonas pentaromativorans]MED5523521.1 hypothetical protein [Pseudomonadota bacterium]